MNKILTRKEWGQSVAETFSAAVESTYKSMIEEAVRQEREVCAKMADAHGFYGEAIAKDIRARGNT